MHYIQIIDARLKELGITAKKMLLELGYSDGMISTWRKGVEPSAIKLHKIAEYLQLSVDYLMTGKEPLAKELTYNQQELLSLWERLDYEKQIEFKGELKGYIRAKAEEANKKGIDNAEFVEKSRADLEMSEEFERKRA